MEIFNLQASLGQLRRWGTRLEQQYRRWRGHTHCDGRTPTQDGRAYPPTQTQTSEEQVTLKEEMREFLIDPACSARVKFWAKKYQENRTLSPLEQAKVIQQKLMQEFPALGRKAAHRLALRELGIA